MTRKSQISYSVAMSKDTGCIVMVRTNGKSVSVMGSLTREQSLAFVRDIMDWSLDTIRKEGPRILTMN